MRGIFFPLAFVVCVISGVAFGGSWGTISSAGGGSGGPQVGGDGGGSAIPLYQPIAPADGVVSAVPPYQTIVSAGTDFSHGHGGPGHGTHIHAQKASSACESGADCSQ